MRVIPIKKRQLEIILQQLEAHPNPNPMLEQYTTPGDIAAELLHLAYMYGDIQNKVIYDLGCGSGRLAIGAALLGAAKVIGVDIDPIAIGTSKKNAKKVGVSDKIDWIISDVNNLGKEHQADTVIQNPPFGAQLKGSDRLFIKKALEIANIIYSLHRGGQKETQKFLQKFIEECGGKVDKIIELDFKIPHMFPFHRKELEHIKVDLYRITRRKKK